MDRVKDKISSNYDFSVSPNWNINRDGICDTNDKTTVYGQYGKSGAPGWIREDVDNKGQIQVVDLVLISMHYGKTW
jgi:hypothetical protein